MNATTCTAANPYESPRSSSTPIRRAPLFRWRTLLPLALALCIGVGFLGGYWVGFLDGWHQGAGQSDAGSAEIKYEREWWGGYSPR